MRRPARLERAGALTPRDRIWAAIRGFGAHGGIWFSVAEIMVLSGQRADTVCPYLEGLEKAGYIADAMELRTLPLLKRRELRRYRLVRDVGVEAPRVDRDGKPTLENVAQQQMWNAMRVMKGDFDRHDLLQCCPHQIAPRSAKAYLMFLARAGYLHTVSAGKGQGAGGVLSRYRFIRARNTGPRPPLVTRDKNVMDGNTGEIVYQGRKEGERKK